MNYIAELKAFYDRLELNPAPSPAIALWHALMSIANKTGWQRRVYGSCISPGAEIGIECTGDQEGKKPS